MSRPPALNPQQQDAVRRRLAEGEGVRALAREFNTSDATIRRLSSHSSQIRNVAETLAAAQTALAALPLAQQHQALSLADKLRSISENLASAAELGAKTSHRLQALANSQVAKVDDADPMKSIGALRDVGVLTKLANDSASIALNLLAANKGTVEKLNTDKPEEPGIDSSKLSSATLAELLAARGPV
jgi:glutamine synthetase adenylyltransferase